MSLGRPSFSEIELTRQLSDWFTADQVPDHYLIAPTLASPRRAFTLRYPIKVRMSSENRPSQSQFVKDLQEARRWCEDRFGQGAYLFSVDKKWNRITPGATASERSIWDTRRPWVAVGPSFFFHDATHAMEFKLSWA